MMSVNARPFFSRYGASILSAVTNAAGLIGARLPQQNIASFTIPPITHRAISTKTPAAYPLMQGIGFCTHQAKVAKCVYFTTRPLFELYGEGVVLNCRMNVCIPGLPWYIEDKIPVIKLIEEEIFAYLCAFTKRGSSPSPALFLDELQVRLPAILMHGKGIQITQEKYLYSKMRL